MIIDKIENISKYKEVPAFALDFIKNITHDIKEGRYELVDESFANVESYSTKAPEVAKFEAHKDYIDIQLLITGNERIYYTDVEGLNLSVNPAERLIISTCPSVTGSKLPG